MFNFKNRATDANLCYKNAVKDAMINVNDDKKITHGIFVMSSFLLLGSLSFLGYSYLLKNSKNFSGQNTKVMGVSHVATNSHISQSDVDYAMEINRVSEEPSADVNYGSEIIDYIDTDIGVDSREDKGITIVVKKGDTLVTLAKRYYNDPTAYDKIIDSNRELTRNSYTIYPGQELKIPAEY